MRFYTRWEAHIEPSPRRPVLHLPSSAVARSVASLVARQNVRVALMDESNNTWHRAFVVFVAMLCGASIGAIAGFEFRGKLQRDIDAQPKARPTVANPPQLIPCSPEGRIEHDRVCRARMRSGKVGQ